MARMGREEATRILPIGDTHAGPGGLCMRIAHEGITLQCADPDLGRWIDGRHPNLWADGWHTDAWSRQIRPDECLAACSDEVRGWIEELGQPDTTKAAITRERLTVLHQALKIAKEKAA